MNMKKYPLVSIITPTYNHEKFIGQCIKSVLSQTYPSWEQIIIDDGSTDRTEDIVAQFNDERIKYIRQDNIGILRLSETYNRALRISQGSLIAVLEGDDFWPPYKLERQVPAFDMPAVVLSWGKAAVTNRNGRTLYINTKNLRWFEHRSRTEVLQKLILNNFIVACTSMCRKDALQSIGGFQQPRQVPYVDYPTWLELSLIGEFKPVDEVLGFWRLHEDQISTIMMMEMAKAGNHCAMSFFQRLPYSERICMGLDMKELQDVCLHSMAAMYFHQGRMNLLGRRWLEARESFGQALHEGTPFIRAKAFAGIICSYLRLDMEWAALLMRKPHLSNLL
jgi:glycosyltransferase involved in cell wall biosynthesis